MSVPPYMKKIAKTVACALIGCCLDYANSVLYDTTEKNISKLEMWANAQSATAEIWRGKKKKEEETTGQKYNGLPYSIGRP